MNQETEPGNTMHAIQERLIEQIANMQQIDPVLIDVQEPLANYGLSSIAALTLSGDMEVWLGCELEPTLVWDYPTIEELSNYLAKEVVRLGSVVAAVD
jgi:acyl carrier protein